MKKIQFEKISKWQDETFGESTALSKMAHLREELEELTDELMVTSENGERKRLEFADCFILLFGAAASDGMSYEDICKCIEEKMQINYKRIWGVPQENGVVNHIKS